MTCPGAGETWVVVVRVLPWVEPHESAGLADRAPLQLQQRSVVDTRCRGHPGQGTGARTPCQPEQNGLRLVVEGVPEQHHSRSVGTHRRVQGRVAGTSGRGLRAPGPVHPYGGDPHRVQTEPAQHRGDGLGSPARTILEAVIHRDRAGPSPQTRRLEGEGPGQGQRIGSATARHQRDRLLRQGRQHPTDRRANGGHGGRRPTHSVMAAGRTIRSIHAEGLRISSMVGKVSGEVHTLLNSAIPTWATT